MVNNSGFVGVPFTVTFLLLLSSVSYGQGMVAFCFMMYNNYYSVVYIVLCYYLFGSELEPQEGLVV